MVRNSFIVVSEDPTVIQKAQQYAQSQGISCTTLTPDQWEKMSAPRAEVPSLVAGAGQTVESAKILQFPGNTVAAGPTDVRRSVSTINQLESQAIENAIAAFKGNLTEAAKALGIGRATLYRKVKQYNIDPSQARKKKAA